MVADQVPAEGSDERALWDDALTALAARGATLVDVGLPLSHTFQGGSTVLDYEFKRDLNAYLSHAPEGAEVRSLAELIAYNNAHADRTLKFGQTHALDAEAKDLALDSADTVRYQADRAQDLVDSKDQIDAVLAEHDLVALLFANADGADIGARAGYPSVAVPAGYLASNRRPFGISLLGPAWSEPALIGYAHDFEQATRLRRPPSVVNPTLFSRVDR